MEAEELKNIIAGCRLNDRSAEETVRRVIEYYEQSAQERYEKAKELLFKEHPKNWANTLFERIKRYLKIASGLTEKE